MKQFLLLAIVSCILLMILFLCKTCNIQNDFYSGLYIGTSNIGGIFGRGVFANKEYNIGDIIEKAPYITDMLNNFTGTTRDYIFTINGEKVALAFGYASLYNHSDEPNAEWFFENDHIIIRAVKKINKNDEILISYGAQYWTSRSELIKKNT